jgi:hypothetical protein
MTKVREALIRLIATQVYEAAFTGVVKKVTGNRCDVAPDDGGPVHYRVRLKPSLDGKDLGIIVKPKVGSAVVVGQIGKNANNLYVVQFSDFDSVLIKSSKGVSLNLNSDGVIELNGNNLGGLVKLQGALASINRLENKLNALIIKFNTHVHTSNGTPTVTTETPVTVTNKIDLENTKVKQGG